MKTVLVAALLLLAPPARGQAPVPGPIVFDEGSLVRHRIQGERILTLPAGGESTMIGVPVQVTISPAGLVVAARVEPRDNYEDADTAPALAAARLWRFRPFTYRGAAVAARGTIRFGYRGAGEWRDRDAPFPPIDYARLSIRLARSACLGECPVYEVTIDGEGNVLFSTVGPAPDGDARAHRAYGNGDGVLLPGIHRAVIGRAALDALIERFREARFFGLKRDYVGGVTDNPTYVLTFASAGRSFTVTDYVGAMAGMPPAVSALEDAVDAAAGTARWISGDGASVAALRSENFDFASPDAARLTAYAAGSREASEQVALDLIEAGVSLDQVFPVEGNPAALLGEQVLLAAIQTHKPGLFARLAARGWLARLPRERLSEAFARYGGGCDPAIARALVDAGADPRDRTLAPRPGTGEAAGRTALLSAMEAHGVCREAERGPIAAALLAFGADVNAADDAGHTVLYGLEDPELQEMLLAAGARADVRDRQGRSLAFSSWTDRIVLGLLDAGADWRGHYDDGNTLRQQARERDMPSVIAWLDAHGIE